MDAMLFFEEFVRMITDGNKDETLTSFRLSVKMKHKILGEREIYFRPDKDTVSAVNDWSKKHTRKTRLQDFLDKHPNAPVRNDGLPKICPYHLGYENQHRCYGSCVECWNKYV